MSGQSGRLNVLLISPLRGLDPPSGDVTYTEQLLASPPPGVKYTTYAEAMANGTLVEWGTRQALSNARLHTVPAHIGIAIWRKLEHLIRRSGFVYREPLRIFGVDGDHYDIVHVHLFHTRFLGEVPPIVMTAGGALRELYRDAWHWSTRRLRVAEAFDSAVGRIWDATMCGVRMGRATRFAALSRDFRDALVAQGWPSSRVDVAPSYLGLAPPNEREPITPRTLGFIAKDFQVKGGHLVMTAFSILRSRHPELRLLIVGTDAVAAQTGDDSKIEWLPPQPRDVLLNEVLPRIDVLLYPTFRDTAVPYGPMEAVAMGIPAVVSDYGAMPDLVAEGAGKVCHTGDAAGLAEAVEDLLEPGSWANASRAASARFREYFSSEAQGPVLGRVYHRALADHFDHESEHDEQRRRTVRQDRDRA